MACTSPPTLSLPCTYPPPVPFYSLFISRTFFHVSTLHLSCAPHYFTIPPLISFSVLHLSCTPFVWLSVSHSLLDSLIACLSHFSMIFHLLLLSSAKLPTFSPSFLCALPHFFHFNMYFLTLIYLLQRSLVCVYALFHIFPVIHIHTFWGKTFNLDISGYLPTALIFPGGT